MQKKKRHKEVTRIRVIAENAGQPTQTGGQPYAKEKAGVELPPPPIRCDNDLCNTLKHVRMRSNDSYAWRNNAYGGDNESERPGTTDKIHILAATAAAETKASSRDTL
jgi:hypothetical protein